MEKKRKEEYASTLWQIRYKQMWQARMENNSADTDGRCSSGQDTRIYIYYKIIFASVNIEDCKTFHSFFIYNFSSNSRIEWNITYCLKRWRWSWNHRKFSTCFLHAIFNFCIERIFFRIFFQKLKIKLLHILYKMFYRFLLNNRK